MKYSNCRCSRMVIECHNHRLQQTDKKLTNLWCHVQSSQVSVNERRAQALAEGSAWLKLSGSFWQQFGNNLATIWQQFLCTVLKSRRVAGYLLVSRGLVLQIKRENGSCRKRDRARILQRAARTFVMARSQQKQMDVAHRGAISKTIK